MDQHRLDILQNRASWYAQGRQTQSQQTFVTPLVESWLIRAAVRLPIHLDGQTRFEAGEVKNEVADRTLTPELVTGRPPSEVLP